MRAAWWWIDRWRQSTAYKDMPPEQRGMYRDLLDEVWLRDDHVLPDDDRILGLIVGDPERWKILRPLIIKHFRAVPGGWTNDTALEVIGQSARRAEKQQRYRERLAAGNKPGNATGNKPGSPSPSPSPSPDQTPTPSPEEESDSVPSERAADKPPRARRPKRKPSGPHADCIRTWEAEWSRTRLGQPWAWQPKDAALMAKALKLASGDPEEVQARTTRLLESGDAWLAANASPGILVSRWNQLAVSIESNRTSNLLDRLLAQAEHAP